MKVDTVADFVRAVRRSGVLDPTQLAQLDRSVGRLPSNPRDAARDFIRRTWLTPYQANQILLGNGSSLLLGTYVLLERLGEGGMGQVFKARHQKLDRVVALKVIRQEKATSRPTVRRFRREMKASAQLSHPNIVMAFDADQAGDIYFLVMEYVEGIDLSEMVKQRGPLPAEQACGYIRQASSALQHAHDRGLVHRDIKPHNFIVAKGGQVKLLDLGLARLQDGAEESGTILTVEGKIVGTVDFLSPEQATNSRRADIRSDLYSLGCTFYFLLAGRPPFPDGGPIEKLANHRWEEPVPLEKLRQDVPGPMIAVIRKLMAKRPEDRYQTPAEVLAALGGSSSSRIAADLPSAVPVAMPVPTPVRMVAPPQVARPFQLSGSIDALPVRSGARRPLWPILTGLAVLLTGVAFLVILLTRPDSSASSSDRRESPLPNHVTNSANMKLVLIPAGTFLMGTPPVGPGRQTDESPAHDVSVTNPFYVGTTAVTQEQYQAVMGNNPSQFQEKPHGGPNHPVERVTWEDALKFCRKLSDHPDEKKAGRVYRLPTEAEWEYACRAGSKKAYCFGDDHSLLNQYGWFGQAPEEGTQEVGKLKPNAWGLYDVHGNVWQWCQDWYDSDYYKRSPRTDPLGPEVGATKVCRGGSWESGEGDLRSARRSSGAPTTGFRNTGFRVVAVPQRAP